MQSTTRTSDVTGEAMYSFEEQKKHGKLYLSQEES